MEPLTKLRFNERLLDLPINNRPGWKKMETANTLSYNDTATITAVKFFIAQAAGVKSFM